MLAFSILSSSCQIVIQDNIQYLVIWNNNDNYDIQIFIVNAYGLKDDELPVQLKNSRKQNVFQKFKKCFVSKIT